jgi:hypothetical protein
MPLINPHDLSSRVVVVAQSRDKKKFVEIDESGHIVLSPKLNDLVLKRINDKAKLYDSSYVDMGCNPGCIVIG